MKVFIILTMDLLNLETTVWIGFYFASRAKTGMTLLCKIQSTNKIPWYENDLCYTKSL